MTELSCVQGFQPLNSPDCSWEAISTNGSVRVPSTVPGQIHLDLERAGVIGDTYFRFNALQDNAWVSTLRLILPDLMLSDCR